MIKTIITCDYCNNDLSDSEGYQSYRVVVGSERIPNSSNISYGMLINDPIPKTMHFCGTGCLSNNFK